MHQRGALANPETGAALRKLAEAVREAAALPERKERPPVERPRRPGWVMPLVRDALRGADEPMTAADVVRAIEKRHGEQMSHDSVLYVLTRSRQARRGMFERIEPARYRLAASRS